ncbi:cytochrome P450 oxidoreductase [Naematelia encephala]|uniref:NADPH--hemoprotein reductase n=1 Tax=Naematelia encephala TaxID=71784 RepID=A0A1Y2AMM0_9TREE|nr:cytochrome P450 oxidoreductase [Naematelia encephala]
MFIEELERSKTLFGAVCVLVFLVCQTIYRARPNKPSTGDVKSAASISLGTSVERDFVERLSESKKRCICFYSSQTGTARRFAGSLARELKDRCQIPSMLANVADYDFVHLDRLSKDSIVAFVIATYGDGEPTDSGREFYDFLNDTDVRFSMGGQSLPNLRYMIFGCGNSSYEHFNKAAHDIDQRLQELGAIRTGTLGLGDDDHSLEEDYIEWKDATCDVVVASHPVPVENVSLDTLDFRIVIPPDEPPVTFHGELSWGKTGTEEVHEPFPAPVIRSIELFEDPSDRSCVHTELDIGESGMSYQPGDHVGIWPCNPDLEVERMLLILGFGVGNKRHTILDIEALDPTLADVPFPTPTTLIAIFRHYLDISSIPSRQLVAKLAHHAPSESAAAHLRRLGSDRTAFNSDVVIPCMRLAEILMCAAGDDLSLAPSPCTVTTWPKVSIETLISMIPRLQPRYYSISSSPRLYPNHVHITSVVVREAAGRSIFDTRTRYMYGLGTNFLLQIKHALGKEMCLSVEDALPSPRYDLEGPRSKYLNNGVYSIPMQIRHSTFRLPQNPRIPVIMIGPGTGVAPFRGFVQDRVAMANSTRAAGRSLENWAEMHLFYGCRKSDEDFLYKNEWPGYAEALEGRFHMHCAFSREAPLKPDGGRVYVQDLLWMERKEISRLILEQNAFIYVCGDAKSMSKAVELVLTQMLAEARGGSAEIEGRKELKVLKDRRRLLLDVWA